MLKTTGLVLILLFCTSCGGLMALRLRKRTAALKKSQLFIHLLSERLSYTLCPVEELFLALAEEPLLEELDYIPDCSRRMAGRAPFPEAFCESVSQSRLPLSARDREVISSLSPIVGASSAENQLQGLMLVKANLSGQAEQAQEQAEKRSRLYLSLGILSGAALAVLLL
ncbi:MAG: hypothetical protein HFG27_13545 [Provencibacterium sp.]|jgi:stage III sporulation protein AB|nr:hypothetical protein [Provencibacterium sp.]